MCQENVSIFHNGTWGIEAPVREDGGGGDMSVRTRNVVGSC